MKSKFLAYLRIKPFLYAITQWQLTLIAFLLLIAIFYNQYLNHRLKFVNTDPWIVKDVVSGDRFTVNRGDETLNIQLCGISASEGSKEYLRSLLNKGDGSVILDRVKKQKETTIAEVFVQLKPDYQEIHLNTEMLSTSTKLIVYFNKF